MTDRGLAERLRAAQRIHRAGDPAPDDQRGQIVKAFVVAAEDVSPSESLVKELQDFVKSQIAPYKYPRAVEFVNDLPKTETGKIQRYKLRALE